VGRDTDEKIKKIEVHILSFIEIPKNKKEVK